MTREMVRTLSDSDLEQVGVWIRQETQERALRRKQEVLSKIKALAAEVGVTVTIGGARGRPAKPTGGAKEKR